MNNKPLPVCIHDLFTCVYFYTVHWYLVFHFLVRFKNQAKFSRNARAVTSSNPAVRNLLANDPLWDVHDCSLVLRLSPRTNRFSVLQATESWARPGNEANMTEHSYI